MWHSLKEIWLGGVNQIPSGNNGSVKTQLGGRSLKWPLLWCSGDKKCGTDAAGTAWRRLRVETWCLSVRKAVIKCCLLWAAEARRWQTVSCLRCPTIQRADGLVRLEIRVGTFCFVLFCNLHENVSFGSLNLHELAYKWKVFPKEKTKKQKTSWLAEKLRRSPGDQMLPFLRTRKRL